LKKFLGLNIPIIEDCAVAIGGSYRGKKLGSFGKVSVFSFYATKMIATGEGGMILTDDEKIANEVRELRDYTKHTTFKVRYNYKMTDMEAALGICQIKKLEQFIVKRKILFNRYIESLKNREDIILPCYNYEESTTPSFYRFIIKLQRHDLNYMIEAMRNRGIICGRGVLQPLHKLLGLNHTNYSNSEKLSREALSLPLYPSLSIEEIDYIVECLMEILDKNRF
jgi:perosamine synthetase